MSFNLIAENALLKNSNPKNENHGEDLVTRIDANFSCVVDEKILMPLLGITEPPAFWTEQGAVIFPGLTVFGSKAMIKEAQLTFGDLTVNTVRKVSKFSFTLLGNRQVEVELQAQFLSESDDQLVAFIHAQKQRAKLMISAAEQQDIFNDSK